MKYVNLLIKPVSSLCDLRCKYCFYADIAAKREVKQYGIMETGTMTRLIETAFAAADPGGTVSFAFQGGEPTLAGLPFFEAFTQTVHRLQKPGIQVNYAIQTNGMTVDEKWAEFLREHQFLVGLSIDGDKETHDMHRVDQEGNGTWARAIKAFQILQQYQVETNILCVVSNACSRRPQKVYAALKKLGARYLQFIPCLDPWDEVRGVHSFSLRPERYGKFLCTLFDAWFQDWKSGHYVSIRLFDDYVHLLMGLPGSSCSANGRCGSYLVVESDGSLYPCDFYVLDSWRLGSIYEDKSLTQIIAGEVATSFYEKGRSKPEECSSCPWFRCCFGGCPRDWYMAGSLPHNYFCAALRMFFQYAAKRLEEIAAAEAAIERYQVISSGPKLLEKKNPGKKQIDFERD